MRALIGLLICLVVVAGSFTEYHKVHSVAKGVFGAGDGKISKVTKGEPVSVLAIGNRCRGFRSVGNKGGNTDSLELFTINPKKENNYYELVFLVISFVRVETSDGLITLKINAAYSINGPKQTVKQVSELLDVPIDYYAVINMGVLEKVIVNSVGGVEVDNPFAFDYEGHHFKKANNTLMAQMRLKYSRMRYDDPNMIMVVKRNDNNKF